MAYPLIQTAQAKSASTVTEATRNVAITASLPGSSIVVAMQSRNTGATPSVNSITDNQSNTYTIIPGTDTTFGSAQGRQTFFLCQNAKQSVTQVTGNVDVNACMYLQVFELQGLVTYDKVVQATSTSTSAASGSTGNISQDDEFIIGVTGAHIGTGSIGAATNYTMQTQLQNAGAPVTTFRTGYQINTRNIAAYSWTTTLSSALWIATLVTFKILLRPVFNNYEAVKAGDGMSVTEKIR